MGERQPIADVLGSVTVRQGPSGAGCDAGLVDVLVRRWSVADAQALHDAVLDSVEHLRPWMSWAGVEPTELRARRALLKGWRARWDRGEAYVVGAFAGAQVVAGLGVHRSLGPRGLEIGYWVRAGWTGRGLATGAGALLTDAALSLPEIDLVEIHHDRANGASGAVPRKLGYSLIGEFPDAPEAPGEVGVECRWRMSREQWTGEVERWGARRAG